MLFVAFVVVFGSRCRRRRSFFVFGSLSVNLSNVLSRWTDILTIMRNTLRSHTENVQQPLTDTHSTSMAFVSHLWLDFGVDTIIGVIVKDQLP